MKNYLLPPLAILTLTLTGCVVNSYGGYADVCNLQERGPWKVSQGSYKTVINGAAISIYADHLYLEKTATLIEMNAHFSDNAKGHTLKFSEKNAYVELRGKKFYPHPGLMEDPMMQLHWHCGGKTIQPATNIQPCTGVVLTFDEIIKKGDSFNLHLGTLIVDDGEIDIPDIQFCYIPQRFIMSKFHG